MYTVESLTLVWLFTDVLRSASPSPGIRRVPSGRHGPVGGDAQLHLKGGDNIALVAAPLQNGIVGTAGERQRFGENVQSQAGR